MDPNLEQQLIKEFDEQLSNVINSIVPSTEQIFITSIKNAFIPIREYVFNKLSDENTPADFSVDLNLTEVIKKQITTLFDNNKNFSKVHQGYIEPIFHGLMLEIFNSNFLIAGVKEDIINKTLRVVDDLKFVHGESVEKAVFHYESFLKRKSEELKQDGVVGISMTQYFKNLELEQLKKVNKNFLFNYFLIEELDERLRGTWFNADSVELALIFFKDTWTHLNPPRINWLKSRNALLELIWSFRGHEIEMNQLVISELISKCFSINDKSYTSRQISKSLNKFLESDNRRQTKEIRDIVRIFYEASTSLESRSIFLKSIKTEDIS